MNQSQGVARTWVCLCGLLIAGALSIGTAPASMTTPVLSNVPTSPEELRRIRDDDDYVAMRMHGWELLEKFASRWEQWPRSDAALADPDLIVSTGSTSKSVFPMSVQAINERETPYSDQSTASAFIAPRDLESVRFTASSLKVRRPTPWVTVHFNPDAAQHIRTHRYGSRDAFLALQPQSSSDNSPATDRPTSIEEFPSTAIAVKGSWRIVPTNPAPGEVWVLPTWDPREDHNTAAANPPLRWKRSIALDFSPEPQSPGRSIRIRLGRKLTDCNLVPITRFHRRPLSPRECDDLGVPPNSQAILVALHIATKELPEWVWATYWWHDLPDDGPFAEGRPSSLSKSTWGNYLMDIDFARPLPSQTTYESREDISPRPIFNPWLEGSFRGGLASNCISCHQQASVTSDLHATPFTPIPLNPLPANDPSFNGRTRTDFVWSLTGIGERP